MDYMDTVPSAQPSLRLTAAMSVLALAIGRVPGPFRSPGIFVLEWELDEDGPPLPRVFGFKEDNNGVEYVVSLVRETQCYHCKTRHHWTVL